MISLAVFLPPLSHTSNAQLGRELINLRSGLTRRQPSKRRVEPARLPSLARLTRSGGASGGCGLEEHGGEDGAEVGKLQVEGGLVYVGKAWGGGR
jgi:hypothetical protein